MQVSLFILGVILLTAGVAFIYWPASLILFGSFCIFIAIRMSSAVEEKQSTPDPISHYN